MLLTRAIARIGKHASLNTKMGSSLQTTTFHTLAVAIFMQILIIQGFFLLDFNQMEKTTFP